jgi:NAD(P)-dependent dehydrogenase (short-subunit alcohol dehydrogenase family)
MVRTALVTGGNRGIGYETCRQLAQAGLEVVLTARSAAAGQQAAARLAAEHGGRVRAEVLDVSSSASVTSCADRLAEAGISVDVLVNNAGVYPTRGFLGMSEEVLEQSLQVNLMGAFRTCSAFLPGMIARDYGRVVNVSSGGGAMTRHTPAPPAYGIAKAALNALTLVADAEVPPSVKINAMCPGWVRTDMGGPGAPLSAEQGADTAVWLATIGPDGPHGGFFRDRRPIEW